MIDYGKWAVAPLPCDPVDSYCSRGIRFQEARSALLKQILLWLKGASKAWLLPRIWRTSVGCGTALKLKPESAAAGINMSTLFERATETSYRGNAAGPRKEIKRATEFETLAAGRPPFEFFAQLSLNHCRWSQEPES